MDKHDYQQKIQDLDSQYLEVLGNCISADLILLINDQHYIRITWKGKLNRINQRKKGVALIWERFSVSSRTQLLLHILSPLILYLAMLSNISLISHLYIWQKTPTFHLSFHQFYLHIDAEVFVRLHIHADVLLRLLLHLSFFNLFYWIFIFTCWFFSSSVLAL